MRQHTPKRNLLSILPPQLPFASKCVRIRFSDLPVAAVAMGPKIGQERELKDTVHVEHAHIRNPICIVARVEVLELAEILKSERDRQII